MSDAVRPKRMLLALDSTDRFVLNLPPCWTAMSDDQYFEFCQANDELWIERTAEGDFVVTPSAGAQHGGQSFNLTGRFGLWVGADGTGIGFGSSAGFTLPNGAVRSPDLAWIRRPRWQALSKEQQRTFAPVCPDFVVELRSPSDRLEDLQAKLAEYLANGAELGWLIDPLERKVHVCRPGHSPVILADPVEVAGDPTLPGFVLKLAEIWG